VCRVNYSGCVKGCRFAQDDQFWWVGREKDTPTTSAPGFVGVRLISSYYFSLRSAVVR
jgi:hypothetical protein